MPSSRTPRVLTASLLVSWCAACSSNGSKGEHVTLGVLLPYTGEASALSSNLEKGSLLAVERMNRAGGANGLPIEIVFGNTFSDSERAVEQARLLVDQGAIAVIGPGGDEGAEPVYAALSEFGVPLLSPLASALGQGAGTAERPWFRMAPTTRVLGENLAKVVGESGTEHVVAIMADDLYHAEIGAAFVERYAAYGKVEMAAKIDERSIDVEDLVHSVSDQLDAGAQGVMLAMQPRPAARLATELAALRGAKPAPNWFLTPRLKTELLLQNASPGAFGAAIGIAPQVFNETRAEFEQLFQEQLDDKPFDPTFYMYDATVVALLAIDRALASEKPLPEGIPQAIEEVASFGGVQVSWDGFEQARQINRAHGKMQYSGLTGPVILANDGSRIIGTTSLWGVQDEAIIER
jgi:ABC-type branched-subunit amino acid transport system substrate-binding protein